MKTYVKKDVTFVKTINLYVRKKELMIDLKEINKRVMNSIKS